MEHFDKGKAAWKKHMGKLQVKRRLANKRARATRKTQRPRKG